MKAPGLKGMDFESTKSLSEKKSEWSQIRNVMLGILAIFFIFAGVKHFTTPEFFMPLMPSWIPYHLEMVYLSGVFEILGGLGLLVP